MGGINQRYYISSIIFFLLYEYQYIVLELHYYYCMQFCVES